MADGGGAGLITLPALLRHHAEVRGANAAFIGPDTGRSISYAELRESAASVAGGLRAAGIEAGGRIAFLGKNSLAYFELLMGVAAAGGVMVPIGWRLSRVEIAAILEDAQPSLLFVETSFLPLVEGASQSVVAVAESGDGLADWRAGLSPAAMADVDPDAVVVQLYTSGTTGLPKGVMLTHRNLLQQRADAAKAAIAWDRWNDRDVSLISMPIAHISGTGWGLYHIHAGAAGVVIRDFDPPAVLQIARETGVTRMFVVPVALKMLAAAVPQGQAPPETICCITYGGSPIDPPTLAAVRAVFKSCDLVQLYGMTEYSGCATGLGPDEHRAGNPQVLVSAGKPLPGVEIAIIDRDGLPLPQGQAGEVAIRGSGVMKGYAGQAEATAAVIDAHGWFRTGDVGEIDAAGYLHIRDRLKDMIISGGENVYAAEVEKIFSAHPQVAELAVIGTVDERWGELVTAVIVPRDGCTPTARDLEEWGRGRIASYKLPRSVMLRAELPRNASGKVLKRELRAQIAGPVGP